MCGGTSAGSLSPTDRSGLSPRVRGNPDDRVQGVARRRSIPACAGEPPTYPSWLPRTSVYPRVCGGTLCEDLRKREDSRSIPACAGEPARHVVQLRRDEVYPRVCGGTQQASNQSTPTFGLSPRVRGNRIMLTIDAEFSRSIPACAGEPIKPGSRPTRKKVYPRVCGGTRLDPGHGEIPACAGEAGSIPACAGEPMEGMAVFCVQAVYPRVCGGTYRQERRKYQAERSIPACAGEPLS